MIEVLICGVPVVAGNQDGSVDVLKDRDSCQLVDPENDDEIFRAIEMILKCNIDDYKLSYLVLQKFGFEKFKNNLHGLIQEQ